MTVLTWVKIGAVVLILSLIVFTGYKIHSWKVDAEQLPVVKLELKAEVDCAKGSKCLARVQELEGRSKAITETLVMQHEQEINSLRTISPRRVRCTTSPGNVHNAGTAARTGEGAASSGMVYAGAGKDIGPDLYRLARIADELSAQCRAVIHRDIALAKRPDTSLAVSAAGT